MIRSYSYRSCSKGEYPVSTGTGQGYFGNSAEQAIYYYDQKSTALPHYQRYITDVQQAMGTHGAITFSYIGAQGRKESNYVDVSLPPYQTGHATINAFGAPRPNNAGRFSDIYVQSPALNSHYNAGIVQYQHVFGRGFPLMRNYTWDKTVSDYPWISNLSGVTGFQYPNLHHCGEPQFSHRNRFVVSGICEPVYGATWSQWAKLPMTGWRLTGIATVESGDALAVTNTVTSAADYAGLDELNLSGRPNLRHGQKTVFQQFNNVNFLLSQEGIRGNSGLGTVRGPGQENVDLSLAKTFPVYDRYHAEFRADDFNALNHAQWNAVQPVYPHAAVGSYGNISFGEATDARTRSQGYAGRHEAGSLAGV